MQPFFFDEFLCAILFIFPDFVLFSIEYKLFDIYTDTIRMEKKKPIFKKAERCLYLKVCYLADELKCFGYKTDCPLYMRSNNEECSEEAFNTTMDTLINKTMQKYQNSPVKPIKKEKIS